MSKQVEGAVVNISSEQVIQMSQQEEMFRRFFGDQGPFGNVPRSRRENSLGSGVIVDPAGYVLTNNHVVDRGTKITVKLHDGREIVASVVGKDPATDLAVVKISALQPPRPAAGRFEQSRSRRLGAGLRQPVRSGENHDRRNRQRQRAGDRRLAPTTITCRRMRPSTRATAAALW